MKSFSLTRRIIATVVTCQLLLAVGLILVAVIYGRSELKGAFDTALDGKAMSALALLQYTPRCCLRLQILLIETSTRYVPRTAI